VVRYAHAPDGGRIAWSVGGGRGQPLIHLAGWMSHLMMDWGEGEVGEFNRALATRHRLITIDPGRGNPVGHSQAATEVALLLEAFPDLHVELEEVIESGDRTVSLVTLSGTNTGAWAPTVPRPARAAPHVPPRGTGGRPSGDGRQPLGRDVAATSAGPGDDLVNDVQERGSDARPAAPSRLLESRV